MKIALIGLGAIGVPIAHKLHGYYHDDFLLIADEERKRKFQGKKMSINGEVFEPIVISEADSGQYASVDLLIICVKNYSLNSVIRSIDPFIGDNTVILPLQNGIYSYDFFKSHFPKCLILKGYVQGPNTEEVAEGFKYENPGDLHIGSEENEKTAHTIVDILSAASIPAFYENDIVKMVWKKWMLNIAGNSITALTGADYSLFKLYSDLQNVCRQAMMEFLTIAASEGIPLDDQDVEDVIRYYVSYSGSKKTSMLMDVLYERKTENDYLAGKALQLAQKHDLKVPIISTLYYLTEVKEEVYMERNGCRATDLYTEGIEYSDALRVQMNDLNRQMKDMDYAELISQGSMPDSLHDILQYAVDNSMFYAKYAGFSSIRDFPVVDKELLKDNYEGILVHSYEKVKTHRMYTSGSTGMPFVVVQDLAKRERNIADLKYFGCLAGYVDHDSMCYLRAKPVVSQLQQEKDNIWQLDISSLSEKNLRNYFHVIVEKRCTALVGNASTLDIAVDYWSSHFENETLIKTIISTSESLATSTREKLKRYFGDGVGIYARYSNSEQGILGQETATNGVYSLNWGSYYFEVLKMDSDDPADIGEIGRIIVTDLYNKAFPMIRYETGDTGRIIMCEKGFPALTDLCGRQMDIIYDVTGEPVSPFLLSRTMRHSKGVKQWQFIQEGPALYTLKINYNGGLEPDLDEEIMEFKKTLGMGSQINVSYIDSDTVKNAAERKIIISKLKRN